MPSQKDIKFESKMSSSICCMSDFLQETNKNCVEPIITMKTLSEVAQMPIDSGYITNDWLINQDSNQITIKNMSQSIQEALDFFMCTIFDFSKLIEAVLNWNNGDNIVRYFVDLVASMAESDEFGITCRDHVVSFIQNIAFNVLDNHHLYNVSFGFKVIVDKSHKP